MEKPNLKTVSTPRTNLSLEESSLDEELSDNPRSSLAVESLAIPLLVLGSASRFMSPSISLTLMPLNPSEPRTGGGMLGLLLLDPGLWLVMGSCNDAGEDRPGTETRESMSQRSMKVLQGVFYRERTWKTSF